MKARILPQILLFAMLFSVCIAASSCVMVYFTSDYAKQITRYLPQGDGEWVTSFWEYDYYFDFANNYHGNRADSIIIDTTYYPTFTWVFTNEDGTDVHGVNRKGYILFDDGTKQDFEWDIYGKTQYEETPEMYFYFPDSNNIFKTPSLTVIAKFYQDNLFRFSFSDAYYEPQGYYHEETLIELKRK
jgi:hypothetical protein